MLLNPRYGTVGLLAMRHFFLAAVATLLSIAAVFLEELRLRRYPRWSDLLKLTVYGILENVGYRQTNTAWQVLAIVSFLRKNTDWGAMDRQGFDPAKKTTRN